MTRQATVSPIATVPLSGPSRLRPRLLDGKGRGDGMKRGKRVRCPPVAGVPKSPRPAAFDVKPPLRIAAVGRDSWAKSGPSLASPIGPECPRRSGRSNDLSRRRRRKAALCWFRSTGGVPALAASRSDLARKFCLQDSEELCRERSKSSEAWVDLVRPAGRRRRVRRHCPSRVD